MYLYNFGLLNQDERKRVYEISQKMKDTTEDGSKIEKVTTNKEVITTCTM